MGVYQTAPKNVIINADDLGLASAINRGIFEAHRFGTITSSSILANGDSLSEALEMISDYSNLSLGLHLGLVFGKPVAKSEKVSSLIEKNGEFPPGYMNFALRYLSDRVKLAEVEYEWQSQREKLGRIDIDHLDSHQHLHLFPRLFQLVIKLAKEWGIPFVRVPYENIHISQKGNSDLSKRVLNCYCKGKKEQLTKYQLLTTNYFFGSSFSGSMEKSVWEKLFPVIPQGLTEIICHPGYENREIRLKYGWRNHWQEELEALLSPELKNLAIKEDINFVNFRDKKTTS